MRIAIERSYVEVPAPACTAIAALPLVRLCRRTGEGTSLETPQAGAVPPKVFISGRLPCLDSKCFCRVIYSHSNFF